MLESLIVIALCVVFGMFAAYASRRPDAIAAVLPKLGHGLRAELTAARPKQFSPRRTLFLIGPSVNHAACRLQRRLIKPALAALIRDDVSVIELYGDEPARKNGAAIDWLDPALLRHAMEAETGFHLIYVDGDGKTAFRSSAPVVTQDLLERAGLIGPAPGSRGFSRRNSAILKRLRAA
ncbi:MAG: hypothetical protein K2Q06_08940 [Parvularculaceae bacterium]|nr:hypothetical protein [Parvularculaceae bacterium]